MKECKVSVLMPVYNGEKYLAESIQSILNQTFTDFEFIIIDDGSTDGSNEIILSFKDDRIVYIKNKENIGLIKSLNKGMLLCRGKYIARMDADDIAAPRRLERQYMFLEKHSEAGLCGTWARVIDNNGNITGKIVNQTSPEFIKIYLLFSVPLVHPSVCIRANLLKENLYTDVPYAEDYDLWCRLSGQTQISNISEYLLRYRWHDTNISVEKREFQQQNKNTVIKKELLKLDILPSERELYIHTLSFTLFSKGKNAFKTISRDELSESRVWFNRLISNNRKKKIYSHHAFTSFLWCRWIILCIHAGYKRKILFPSFASCHPKTLYGLANQILLTRKKKM